MSRKTRLDEFRTRHPRCAFCAGERETASRDHQPPRVFFSGKRFPDGIDVPACTPCQEISRRAEVALSLVVTPAELSLRDYKNWLKRVEHARKHFPELVPNVPDSEAEIRSLLAQLGHDVPTGVNAELIPLVTVDADDFDTLLETFARKLTLAHHYRAFKQPLSRSGAMFARTIPNAHLPVEKWLDDLVLELPNVEHPKHGSEDLSDQVFTRWATDWNSKSGFFVTQLQQTATVIGMTSESNDWRELLEERGDLLGPFE